MPPLAADDLHLPDGTDEATKAMAAFRVPQGIKLELFAAEPKLGAPVAICLDEQGRVYVAEQYRFNQGTEENRTRPFLLEDDLQLRTVDDRLAMYQKWADKFTGGMEWFSKHADQVRRLEDRDGDGRAERSTIFAGGFNDPLDGLAAGVIALNGDVYFTCIPNLWLLRDTDDDGVADVRKVLHRGFGVNAAFLGHDLHGLVWGPDGRLYFSVGDRGFHVTTREGMVLHGPRTGAVFRCRADGADLELVHRGLRNPQELAFDKYGNLFAADNNCDKGDHSRLVYIVEGGDSGWNMAYQTIPQPYLTGPWHAEQLWHLAHEGQPAWIVPPVGKLGAGPSGFMYTSGVSLPARYRDRFFHCNYTGGGGVESFGVRPQGAGFEMFDYHDFLKPLSATDVTMGYDGKLYVSDFVKLEWNGGGGKGRIYTAFDPQGIKRPAVRQTEQLFRNGFRDQQEAKLLALLAHDDMRVRLRSQYELARRAATPANHESIVKHLKQTSASSDNQIARIHAIWALGQIAETHAAVSTLLLPLTDDSDAEIRAQVTRVLGELRYAPAAEKLMARIDDTSPRVRMFAALGLGKLKHKPAAAKLFAMLADNANHDRFLRHAGVMALSWIGDQSAVMARANDENAAVRLAVLLVLRQWRDERVARFLNDADVVLVTEASRAINDLPLDKATGELAAMIDRYLDPTAPPPDPLLRRVINANFRLGKSENAVALAKLAASGANRVAMRQEALAALADWDQPPQRDRVTGFWRPLEKRDPAVVRDALQRHLTELLASSEGALSTEVARLVTKFKLNADDVTFVAWLGDRRRSIATRVAALRLLQARRYSELPRLIDEALSDGDARLRAEARDLLAQIDRERAMLLLSATLEQGVILERQRALATLAKLGDADAKAVINEWVDRLLEGMVGVSLQLDLVEAAEQLKDSALDGKLTKYRSSLPSGPLSKFRIASAGGDSRRGKRLFVSHTSAQCIRCHKINRQGGDAGPELSKTLVKVPMEQRREHILQSLVDPNAKITPGFGSVSLLLDNGKVIGGTVQQEDDARLVLVTPQNQTLEIKKSRIDERSPAKSPMPAMTRVLSLRDMRDLVEYLATLK